MDQPLDRPPRPVADFGDAHDAPAADAPGLYPPPPGGPYPPPPPAGVPLSDYRPDMGLFSAPPPPWPVPATGPPHVSGLAIASLVVGLFWFAWIGSVLALVLGYAAKREIDASGGRVTGRGLAIAGIVLGWIGVGLLALLILLTFLAAFAVSEVAGAR